MTHIFKNTLIAIFPLIVMASTNLYKDPANIFGQDFGMANAVELLKKGKYLGGLVNYNERELKSTYASLYGGDTDVAIFGSSRCMLFGQKHFLNKSVFNYSVSGATLFDFMGFINELKQKSTKNKTAYFCIDPWMLNQHNPEFRWTYFYDSIVRTGHRINFSMGIDDKKKLYLHLKGLAAELFSPRYFWESLTVGPKTIQMQVLASPPEISRTNTIGPDGYLYYPNKEINLPPDEVLKKVRRQVKHRIAYGFNDFHSISPNLLEGLFSLLEYGKKEKFENIKLVLIPFHPLLYSKFQTSKHHQIALDVESKLKDLANRSGIEIIGSYDPEFLNLVNSDFMDGTHPKENVYDALAGSL